MSTRSSLAARGLQADGQPTGRSHTRWSLGGLREVGLRGVSFLHFYKVVFLQWKVTDEKALLLTDRQLAPGLCPRSPVCGAHRQHLAEGVGP